MLSRGTIFLSGYASQKIIDLYDDFTRPLAIEGFQARAGEVPMEASADGSSLSAKLERSLDPVEVVLHLRFPDETEEARFDFVFSRASLSSLSCSSLATAPSMRVTATFSGKIFASTIGL